MLFEGAFDIPCTLLCLRESGFASMRISLGFKLTAVIGLLYGVAAYALHSFVLYKADTVFVGETVYQHYGLGGLNYIDVMVIVLATSVGVALAANRAFGNRARYVGPWSPLRRTQRLKIVERE